MADSFRHTLSGYSEYRSNSVEFFTPVLIDLAIINLTLIAGISLRFSDTLLLPSPYHAFIVHLLLSISFLFLFAYNGIYSKSKYSISNALLSGLLASLTFFASVYFIQSVAFSRIAFGIVSLATTILLVSWREIIPKVIKFKQLVFSPDQILIVGNGPVASLLIRQVEEMKSGKIKGILWTENGTWPGEYEGYQVLGSISNLPNAIKASKADTLLIATDLPWYSSVIEILSRKKSQ